MEYGYIFVATKCSPCPMERGRSSSDEPRMFPLTSPVHPHTTDSHFICKDFQKVSVGKEHETNDNGHNK